MKELDIESGIGLIEKKRQGQGKPTMIYLKQFMIQDAQKCNNYISGEKSAISEVKNLHVLKCKNVMSRSEEFTHPEVKKLHTNKNNINNTELSNTEPNHIISGNDGMGFDVEAYTEIIKENIELDILLERYPYDRELLTGIFDLILETVLCKNKSIVVASSGEINLMEYATQSGIAYETAKQKTYNIRNRIRTQVVGFMDKKMGGIA